MKGQIELCETYIWHVEDLETCKFIVTLSTDVIIKTGNYVEGKLITGYETETYMKDVPKKWYHIFFKRKQFKVVNEFPEYKMIISRSVEIYQGGVMTISGLEVDSNHGST
jgi:hypothetical protein